MRLWLAAFSNLASAFLYTSWLQMPFSCFWALWPAWFFRFGICIPSFILDADAFFLFLGSLAGLVLQFWHLLSFFLLGCGCQKQDYGTFWLRLWRSIKLMELFNHDYGIQSSFYHLAENNSYISLPRRRSRNSYISLPRRRSRNSYISLPRSRSRCARISASFPISVGS